MNIGNQMKHKPLRFFFFLVACLLATTANAQEIDSLKNEIDYLKQKLNKIDELELRLAELERDSVAVQQNLSPKFVPDSTAKGLEQVPKQDLRDQNIVPLSGSDLVASEFVGSWPMFGTIFRMKIGGYVKTDFLYDITGNDDRTQFLLATIPVEGTPEYGNGGYFNAFAKETRFNIDIRRVAQTSVPLRVFIEGDFWTAGNWFRLRHAYITAGNFTIGQTWTTVSFLETITIYIDFAAGDALYGGRTAQIRYDHRINDNWKFAVGLEMLDFMGIENSNDLYGEASLRFPVLAGRLGYYWSSGLALLGGQVAQLRWDGGGIGPDATALQASVVFGGRQYIGKEDFFTWNISFGRGSGENIMAFAGSQANAVLNDQGKLETMPAFAFVLGYMHRWNDQFNSNLGYAYGWLEAPESRAAYALAQGGIGHVNLFYTLSSEVSTGIEYMWGTQKTTNGALGRASRVQCMVKFQF
jgi:hypothetical protein